MDSYSSDREIFLIINKSELFTLALIITSSMLCFSSKNWITIWIIIEIRTIRFLFILCREKKKEKILIFFLFQSFSSLIIILYIFFHSVSIEQNLIKTISYIVIITIIVKTGIFPFHAWLLNLSNNINWINITILLTWQKLIPLILLYKAREKTNLIYITIYIIISSNIIILTIINIKKILVISSIIHRGWVILVIKMIKISFLIYIRIYSLILIALNLNLIKENIKSIYHQINRKTSNTNKIILMFSLAGIPPTTGFILKLSVFFTLLKTLTQTNILIILIIISRLSFLVYFKIFYKTINLIKNTKKVNKTNKNKKRLSIWINIATPLLIV